MADPRVAAMPGLEGRFTFRKAAPADARLIEAMVRGLADDIGTPAKKTSTVADLERGLRADPPQFFALVAERDGEPAGMCLWFPWFSTWRGRAGIFVQDLYVMPERRGAGLGRLLLAAAIADDRARGAAFIRLGVDVANDKAIRFYERLGFSTMNGEHMLDLFGAPFEALAHTTPDGDEPGDKPAESS